MVLVADAGGFSAVAQQHQNVLFHCLYVWPMLVFVGSYAGGHFFSSRSFWFDQVCIDQQNLLLRCQALKAVPAFVANATRLVVLYDETYFERLWCMYELAVHSRVGSGDISLVPTWMPILTIFFIIMCTGTGFATTLLVDPLSPKWDATSRSSLFMSVLNTKMIPWFTYPLFGAFMSWFCGEKLRRHRAMLDQLAQFDLRNAKCTLETDRRVIEEQVLSLFDEALEPPVSVAFGAEGAEGAEGASVQEALLLEAIPETVRHVTSYPTHDEIIDQFNAYVRGPLRDKVLKAMGKEDYISAKICMVVALSWFFSSMTSVLGCDGTPDCHKAASRGGFSSVAQYMTCNAIYNILLAPLGTILEFPAMLIACSHTTEIVPDTATRMVLFWFITSVLMYVGDSLMLAQRAVLVVAIVKFSPLWLSGLIATLVLELFLAWFLFCKKRADPAHRTLLTCC